MKYGKPIPIGVEFYKQMIDNGYYYIDKTLLIKDILEQGSTVTLFIRPRRFGKPLTQSMLKTFFEKEILPDGTAQIILHIFMAKRLWGRRKIYKASRTVSCNFHVLEISETTNI